MSYEPVVELLVADALVRQWPTLTPRSVALPALSGKVDAVIGPRRAGKTSLVWEHARTLQAAGVPRESILYLNFEDERLIDLPPDELHLFDTAWFRRAPSVLDGERWFLLDEIQNILGWERYVRRLLDTAGSRIVVTGSSARMLATEVATALRGRALVTEVLPFSFREALTHAGHGVPERWPPTTRERADLQQMLDRYMVTGGFPEVQRLDADLRTRVLREYVDVALLRDVIERHGVTNVPALRSLTRRLLGAPAGRFSVHRFHNDLKSVGLPVAKDSLHAWLGHLEDACFVFFVPVYTESEAVRRSNPRKAYPVDPALSPGGGNLGQRFETVVYLELRRRGGEIAWVSNVDGTEVDFCVTSITGERSLVQACASLADSETRTREIHALRTAMGALGIERGTVVSLDESDERILPAAGIEVCVATKWLTGFGGATA